MQTRKMDEKKIEGALKVRKRNLYIVINKKMHLKK